MTLPTRAEAIAVLLHQRTHLDLAASYHAGMEVQVNVGRDGGESVHGRSKTYTDGLQTWYPLRLPKDAATSPIDNSAQMMTYDLAEHAEAIGMTGWNFLARCSCWVGFDFDAIVGHSERHGKRFSDAELIEIEKSVQNIPWVTVRRSTSGTGLHLYVHFAEPVPTKDHGEHAALGRAVLAMLSAAVGSNLEAKVDACGGNMWVWHRKMKGTKGLECIKRGEPLPAVMEPINWRRHLEVIRGSKRRATLPVIEGEEDLDELSGQYPRIKLDADHKMLIEYMQKEQGWGWWDADRSMLVTHTQVLKKAHVALALRGPFETISPGTELEEQNCFCFPLRGGAWVIRRYTCGIEEASTWDRDSRGYARCYFNRNPDLATAARAAGGIELESGGFIFREAEVAAGVARLLGASFEVPPGMSGRQAKLKMHKDGRRLVVEFDHTPHDGTKGMEGWFPERGKWRRIFNVAILELKEPGEVNHDDLTRHVVSEAGGDAGWFIKVSDKWNHEPMHHVQKALLASGRKRTEVDNVLGASILHPWILVNRPFEEDYPGDRLWNRASARLKYPRTEEAVGPEDCPHWIKVLEHVGQSLTEPLGQNGWALANDVKLGRDYLLLWLASVVQFPYDPLPYLFLYGNQDCGKSIFHEMLDLLISEGIVLANTALNDKERFNAELEGAVICVVEELNLRASRGAYERIKMWVLNPKVSIHVKNLTPYDQNNTMHWIHVANEHDAVPIFPGDTRVVVVRVPDLPREVLIPKNELRERLKREAPAFTNLLLKLEIPPSGDRMRVPVVSTMEKEVIAASNRTALETFLDERVHRTKGWTIPFSEFYAEFQAWLEPQDRMDWTKQRVSRLLPPDLPTGLLEGATHVGNASWEARPIKTQSLILKDKRLIHVG